MTMRGILLQNPVEARALTEHPTYSGFRNCSLGLPLTIKGPCLNSQRFARKGVKSRARTMRCDGFSVRQLLWKWKILETLDLRLKFLLLDNVGKLSMPASKFTDKITTQRKNAVWKLIQIAAKVKTSGACKNIHE